MQSDDLEPTFGEGGDPAVSSASLPRQSVVSQSQTSQSQASLASGPAEAGVHRPLDEEEPASLSAIQRLPKVELHAHLHGSIRESSLRELYDACRESDELVQKQADAFPNVVVRSCADLAHCFRFFDWVYLLMQDVTAIRRLFGEVLEDFYSDGVRYLELRTTPRVTRGGTTKEQYMELLEEACVSAEKNHPTYTIRVVLSINRAFIPTKQHVEADVDDIVALAKKYPHRIVGLDISGDPTKGDLFHVWQVLTERVRQNDLLKLTVHTAEIPANDNENEEILTESPNRLGHACYLCNEHIERVLVAEVPVEICPSSNAITMGLNSLTEHTTLSRLLREKYKHLSICTDDIGLLGTCLSKELHMVASAFGVSLQSLWEIQQQALEDSFASEDTKEKMRKAYYGVKLAEDALLPASEVKEQKGAKIGSDCNATGEST